MRTVPEKQRDDLAAELRASIDDQIDARVGDGEPHGIAERAVLTELGDPEKLAAGYTERPLHLIGPRYYLEWWRLLKLLWSIVVPLAALGIALGQVVSGAAFGEVVGATVSGRIHRRAARRVLGDPRVRDPRAQRGTSPLERNALTKDGPWAPWTLDQLPELRSAGVGVAELVASLVFLGVAAFAVVWDQLVGFVWVDGQTLPVLNPALWPWWIAGLLVMLALEARLRDRALPHAALDARARRRERRPRARGRDSGDGPARAGRPAEPRVLHGGASLRLRRRGLRSALDDHGLRHRRSSRGGTSWTAG